MMEVGDALCLYSSDNSVKGEVGASGRDWVGVGSSHLRHRRLAHSARWLALVRVRPRPFRRLRGVVAD